MRKQSNSQGVAGFLTVMFVALVAVMVVALIQSRLLLSIYRVQSLSDTLISSYAVETEVNDVLAKLIDYDAPLPPGGGLTLSDGTKMKLETQQLNPNTQRISATAERPYAVNKIEAQRKIKTTKTHTNDFIELVLVLDCSGSMNSLDATNFSPPPAKVARLQALRQALLNFLTKIETDAPDPDKFYIGMLAFTDGTRWFKNASGIEIKPDTHFSLTKLKQVVDYALPDSKSNYQSPACTNIEPSPGGTNIGLGLTLAHTYFALPYPYPLNNTNTKRIEVLITDGKPNTYSTFPGCMTPQTFSATGFLYCTVANSNIFVPQISQAGIRDPDVALYAVTVLDLLPTDTVYQLFATHATKYYVDKDAGKLSEILAQILLEITSTASTITIRRVVP